ncbi:MAG: DUF1566 domain-containing protein [bacterium]|nr:DUF1566 domain-containing protein [bacterium]
MIVLITAACDRVNGASDIEGSGAVVDTGQTQCYDNDGPISPPGTGEPFYGQDGQYDGVSFNFQDNGDGTVTDLNTGLMWQQTPDFDNRMSWYEAGDYADDLTLAGYDDWRVPTIKELTSIAAFYGSMQTYTPYIDTAYFDFEYPEPPWRDIDGQYWSSNLYVGDVFNGQEAAFGLNFADAHIKGYPTGRMVGGGSTFEMTCYVRCVRGDSYGENLFVDNGDGTVTDAATGLMWQQSDDGVGRNWEEALDYAEDLDYAGHSDWRLPNAKELQIIVDYSRNDPAINPIFTMVDEDGFYWVSTTHGDHYGSAVYICFGKGVDYAGMDVHGAGALRSDPKAGDPADYPNGRGPQNDEVRIYNCVRCVRDAD